VNCVADEFEEFHCLGKGFLNDDNVLINISGGNGRFDWPNQF
jgi:hypothetical protein